MNGPWSLTPLLDRMGAARHDPAAPARWWRDPRARLLVVDSAGRVSSDPFGCPTAEAPGRPGHDAQRDVLLGSVRREGNDEVWFARRGEVAAGHSLRDGSFEGARLELVTAATAVLAWHDACRFCERCGAPTEMAAGGFQRRCTGCGREIFPRTDPAMIVAVLDEKDRLLLGHQAAWAPGRVSILAGFLEAGESGEHAVVREVREESGLEVTQARFLSSQPWPYPRSLMLGFVARAQGEIRVDQTEIAWARWYSRDELTAALADGLSLPGPGSIAGRIIAAWRAGELPPPEGALRI
ncbi:MULTISPECIES: NAD(+) diphosphatase [unclassified Luteococcus]|uniref:NAD(+) diphosphatase n=1 Tax=unclassified Luteococcus TaxID=2639923 RepID=UPI00313CA30E